MVHQISHREFLNGHFTSSAMQKLAGWPWVDDDYDDDFIRYYF
jgi:hypothetical protein